MVSVAQCVVLTALYTRPLTFAVTSRVRTIHQHHYDVDKMAARDEKGSVGMGGRLRKKIGGGWVSTWQCSINDILPSQDAGSGEDARVV